ncbi:hypothetical protein O1W68_06205 [Rhodococcus sp. H36-A4]|nr:hypothetical protein [Rhodococcus sp. H36-A4]MCZ4077529.1 hypothetical protein [Rhodococcus sp. H36-A4]
MMEHLVDGKDTVWVVADGVRAIGPHSMEEPATLDVATLLPPED